LGGSKMSPPVRRRSARLSSNATPSGSSAGTHTSPVDSIVCLFRHGDPQHVERTETIRPAAPETVVVTLYDYADGH
jgi:hypothetical protein